MSGTTLDVTYEADLLWYDEPLMIGCSVAGSNDVVLGLGLPRDGNRQGNPFLFTRIDADTWQKVFDGDIDLREAFTDRAKSELMWADIVDPETVNANGLIRLQPLGRQPTERDLPSAGPVPPFLSEWRVVESDPKHPSA